MADQDTIFKFRSKEYTQKNLDYFRQVIAQNFEPGRVYISRILAQNWDWRQPYGKIKDFGLRIYSTQTVKQSPDL